MATTYKVLGQSNPSAITSTNLYTVPSLTQSIVSTIIVANQAATSGSYRIAVRPDGATLSKQHYLAYDIPISANQTASYTIGLTIDAGDIITVYASSADFSFSAFGSEIA
jgi:hypothetical protein